jgi:PD-(D/E)XK nuclease family transposase
MLGSLDNEVVFKKAFTNKEVLESFIFDVLGLKLDLGTIETEKKFTPIIGYIDFEIDVFAETKDKRVAVELQRAQYDYNFDRFMHYLQMLVAEQQKSSKKYKVPQTVYMIVVMTLPYKFDSLTGEAVKEEMLITKFCTKNGAGKEIAIYGHQMVCLNPNHPDLTTPAVIRDWLDLFYQSIHNSERPRLNLNHKGIKKAHDLIDFEYFTPQELTAAKNKEQGEIVKSMYKEEGRAEGRAEGRTEGEAKGRTEGEAKGRTEAIQKSIEKALQRGKLSLEEIAEDFEVSVESVREIQTRNA